jgi:hypothetical protein
VKTSGNRLILVEYRLEYRAVQRLENSNWKIGSHSKGIEEEMTRRVHSHLQR